MFARLSRRTTTRALASTSTSGFSSTPTTFQSSTPLLSSPFSTSSPSHESKRLRKARLVRKANIEKKASLIRTHQATQPDPVLGHARGKDDLWTESLLAKTLLKRDEVWGQVRSVDTSSASTTSGSNSAQVEDAGEEEYQPKHYNFGLKEDQVKLLTETLPSVSMMRDFVGDDVPASDDLKEKRMNEAEEREMDKKEKLMRILDLRNAGSKGIQVENVRRIIRTFGENEQDSGRPEVQAAILTARIHSLLDHLVSSPRDIHNRRPLRSMIQQRAKVLKYLRSVDVRRYEDCLVNIGVEPRAVEGEVIVTKPGLRELIRGI